MIYFDHSATTQPSRAAAEAAARAISECWGNPSSTHRAGMSARALLDQSRTAVALSLGVRRPEEGRIIFTSCGTEADQLAIFGAVYAKKRRPGDKILTTDSEHPAVEEAMKRLETEGFTVCRIPTKGGALDFDFIRANAEGVILASLMLVNNEHGALYDVRRAFAEIRAASPAAVTHTDAVQAMGKTDFTPAKLGADMLSVSAHKIGALKGTGALFVSADTLRAKKLIPIQPGGGQEDGMRSGTENLPGIAAFGAAAAEMKSHLRENIAAVTALRNQITETLTAAVPDIRVNAPAAGVPHVLSLSVPGVRSEVMLNHLSARDICISAGSACSARAHHRSGAMLAFGITEKDADCTVRVSISHTNTSAEAAALCEGIIEGAARLRK